MLIATQTQIEKAFQKQPLFQNAKVKGPWLIIRVMISTSLNRLRAPLNFDSQPERRSRLRTDGGTRMLVWDSKLLQRQSMVLTSVRKL